MQPFGLIVLLAVLIAAAMTTLQRKPRRRRLLACEGGKRRRRHFRSRRGPNPHGRLSDQDRERTLLAQAGFIWLDATGTALEKTGDTRRLEVDEWYMTDQGPRRHSDPLIVRVECVWREVEPDLILEGAR